MALGGVTGRAPGTLAGTAVWARAVLAVSDKAPLSSKRYFIRSK